MLLIIAKKSPNAFPGVCIAAAQAAGGFELNIPSVKLRFGFCLFESCGNRSGICKVFKKTDGKDLCRLIINFLICCNHYMDACVEQLFHHSYGRTPVEKYHFEVFAGADQADQAFQMPCPIQQFQGFRSSVA